MTNVQKKLQTFLCSLQRNNECRSRQNSKYNAHAFQVFQETTQGLMFAKDDFLANHADLTKRTQVDLAGIVDFFQQCKDPKLSLADPPDEDANMLAFELTTVLFGHEVTLNFLAQVRHGKIIHLEHSKTTFHVMKIVHMINSMTCRRFHYERFREMFAEIVDKKVTALFVPADGSSLDNYLDQHNRVEFGFDDIFDLLLSKNAALSNSKAYNIQMTPLLGGKTDYVFQRDYQGHQLELSFRVWMTRGGKVIRIERTSAVVLVVENLRNLLNTTSGSMCGPKDFTGMYDKVFDDHGWEPTTCPLSSQEFLPIDIRKEFGFDTCDPDCCQSNTVTTGAVTLESFRPHCFGELEFAVEKVGKDKKVKYRYRAVTRNGKIVKLKRDQEKIAKDESPIADSKVEDTLKVSGQVSGRSKSLKKRSSRQYSSSRISGSSQKQRYKRNLRSIPSHLRGRYLGEGTDLKPCQNDGDVLKIFLMQEKSIVLARNNRFTLTTMGRETYAKGAHIVQRRRAQQEFFILNDFCGIPVVLCQKDRRKEKSCYTILGRTPLYQGDKPVYEHVFYPWFRIAATRMVKRKEIQSISVWNGLTFVPFMNIQCQKSGKNANVTLYSLEDDDSRKTKYASMTRISEGPLNVWTVTIEPAVDPALVLVTTTIVQDFMFGHKLFRRVHF